MTAPTDPDPGPPRQEMAGFQPSYPFVSRLTDWLWDDFADVGIGRISGSPVPAVVDIVGMERGTEGRRG